MMNFRVYGLRKVGELTREGFDFARCTRWSRLMRDMGLQGDHPRQIR